MNLLCIETSTSVCSAAWCIDGQCVLERIHTDGSNHAALLPGFLEQLLAEAQSRGLCADAIAVSAGPGSYTGLRIGVSTAKGLCYGMNIPMIPVPTLDILTEVAISTHPELKGTLVPMIDARRMEVYTQMDGRVFAQVVEDTSWLPAEGPVYFFGDGAKKCQQTLQSEKYHFVEGVIPRASAMGAAVLRHHYPIVEQKALAYYTPFYLKEFIAAPSHIKGLK